MQNFKMYIANDSNSDNDLENKLHALGMKSNRLGDSVKDSLSEARSFKLKDFSDEIDLRSSNSAVGKAGECMIAHLNNGIHNELHL